MIRLMQENDRQTVLDYLYQEPEFNIFPIGDIEAFGFDSDFQRVYGEFDDEDNLMSILLRYRIHAIYYAIKIRFNEKYLDIFKNDPFKHLSGKSELIELIKPYLSNYKFNLMYFCKAETFVSLPEVQHADIHELKKEEDIASLHELLLNISDFRITKDRDEFIKGKLQSLKMGECLFVKDKGKIISTVSTTAETTKSAMVVAVATAKEHRNKGYASRLMKQLMSIYFNDKHKSLCLFYDNPDAGKIYLRLGFKKIGTWTLVDQL